MESTGRAIKQKSTSLISGTPKRWGNYFGRYKTSLQMQKRRREGKGKGRTIDSTAFMSFFNMFLSLLLLIQPAGQGGAQYTHHHVQLSPPTVPPFVYLHHKMLTNTWHGDDLKLSLDNLIITRGKGRRSVFIYTIPVEQHSRVEQGSQAT